MLETSSAQSGSRSIPSRGCKKYEKTIIECTAGSEEGNYSRMSQISPTLNEDL